MELFHRKERKGNDSKSENEKGSIGTIEKVMVFIDNENLWRSIKEGHKNKNINYLELIRFLKENYAPGKKLVINIFISLLAGEEFNSRKQGFFRALDHIEQAYETSGNIEFRVIKVPAKRERVMIEGKFELGEVSHVDQKIIIRAMEEIIPAIRKDEVINTFILVSGDSDYLPLLNLIRKFVTRIIVIAGERNCNKELKISFKVENLEKILERNPELLLDSPHSTFQ